MDAESAPGCGIEADLTEAYRLLSACFCLPERELLREEDVPGRLAAALGPVRPDAAARAADMARELADTDEETLRVDHARLFVGPGPLLAPPYGSVYLEPGGRVLGRTTLEVLAIYREHGLEVDGAVREMPDHIALELEFLHHLGSRARHAVEGPDAVELLARRESFRARYVASWTPDLARRMRENAATRYHAALADCLEGTLR